MAGEPYVLEPHEAAIVANIMGWKRPDGTRRYREVFYFVPRKNSKSTWAAGMLLLILFLDGEPGAECYSTAADRDQASLVYNIARVMCESEHELASRAQVHTSFKTITVGECVYKAISAEAGTKHGFNTHLSINDEIHAHRTSELLDVIQTSTGARRQPLIIHITTSDFEREGSVCNDKYDYAAKVRDGIIEDNAFLPIIYEATLEEADEIVADPDGNQVEAWTQPALWAKANPMMGKSVSQEYLARECQRALDSPAYENTFKRLHLNIRTEQEQRWLQMHHWATCGDGVEDAIAWRADMMDTLAAESIPCEAALDLGATSDLTALVLEFDYKGRKLLIPYFWVPKVGALQKEKLHSVPYLQWIREGFIEQSEGNTTDYDQIRARLNEIAGVFQFKNKEIAIDRLFQGNQLCTQLMDDGFEVFAFGQGFLSMAAPSKDFEERVISGDIQHGNNPVLNWMASNVSIKTDPAGNIKPTKPPREDAAKIDGIVSAVMCRGRAMVREEVSESVYEKRGLLRL
jgi:phage terminase large subunit-like protein